MFQPTRGLPEFLGRNVNNSEGCPCWAPGDPEPFIFQTCFSGSLFYGSKPFTFVLLIVSLPPTIPRDPGQVREGKKLGSLWNSGFHGSERIPEIRPRDPGS